MALTTEQLALASNYQMEAYSKERPADQITSEQPFRSWLVQNKVETIGGNEYFNEKVRTGNDANYQNYSEDDQVTYHRRDPVRLAKFPWASFHDGFGLNEDELARNGIILTDDRNAVATDAEKVQIVNLLEENYESLRLGVMENFAKEALRDGTQDTKAVDGLDALVASAPTTGTVGGIDRSVSANSYWRNNVSLDVAATTGLLLTTMEQRWRDCVRYGGHAPTAIFAGSAFIDAYRKDVRDSHDMHIAAGQRGGVSVDGGVSKLYFKGVEIVWDPIFDLLQSEDSETVEWTKRCYFLNSTVGPKLRPLKGHWMVNRKPPRMYDRYVHYFAMTSKYRITIRQPNSCALVHIA